MSTTTRFTYAGATLVAETSGDGPLTFVLIHGIGMGRLVFRDLADHIRRLHAGARIVALDLPGYGDAPEPSRILTMERTADLVAAHVASMHLAPVVVVGHSMGTQVAVELAARHPRLVERVVLVAPTVDAAERTAVQQALRLAQDLFVESPRVIFIGAREYLRAGPNLRGKFHAMLAHCPERTYPRVAQPALVLRGEHDYVSPHAWAAGVAVALPGGRLAEVPGHGHETMIRDAEPAARLILDFVGGY